MIVLVYVVVLLISLKVDRNDNSISPYECGFDPLVGSRLEFSYRFFLISILFLIFDVEISLLLPFLYEKVGKKVILGIFMFLVVLMVGLLYEY